MARIEVPLPDSCSACPLFENCQAIPGTRRTVTKRGAVNTTIRGSDVCIENFDIHGDLVHAADQLGENLQPVAVTLYRLPPGLVGERRPKIN